MSKNRILILHGFVVIAVIGTLFLQYFSMKSRFESRIDNMTVEADRVKSALQERVVRETADVKTRTKTETLFEAFGAYKVMTPNRDPFYIGEYKEVIPEYKPVKFECAADRVEAEILTGEMKKELKIENQVIGWCVTKGKGLLVVEDEVAGAVSYLVQMGEVNKIVSTTELLGIDYQLASIDLTVIKWERYEHEYFLQEWIMFQLTQEIKPVSGGQPGTSPGYNKYVYTISESGEAVLVEMCNQGLTDFWHKRPALICSHVVKTTSPVLGK